MTSSSSRDQTPTTPNPASVPLPTTPIIRHFAPRNPVSLSAAGQIQQQALQSPAPEFAEFLTPEKLRPKRRRRHLQPLAPFVTEPTAGPSHEGYRTVEGDLYRGAVVDPRSALPTVTGTPKGGIDEDAITIGDSSTTSSSSSWSLGSNLSRGRRATMAVIERFGEAIGVRRGSVSSGDSSVTELRSVGTRRRRRLSTALSRTFSHGTASSAPDRPKRQHLPRRREFTLVLPPSTSTENLPVDRVVTTPALQSVLDRIKDLRHSRGINVESPIEMTRRPRSMPGQKRQSGFAVPRPQPPRSKTRVEMLRGRDTRGDDPTRPKSVSDLMGLANPYSSSTSLSDLRDEAPTPTPSPSQSPPPGSWKEAKQEEGCWWLDVSCPSWEDLRDIGELLGLHPLTLEDVLQQDPREKMDMFEGLGYYFICARALDEGYFKYTPGNPNAITSTPPILKPKSSAPATATANRLRRSSTIPVKETDAPYVTATPGDAKKDRHRTGWGLGKAADKWSELTTGVGREKVEIIEDNPGKEGLEGVGVGAVNVYLVVFADGILSFHYEDITKHTQRVLDRVLSLVDDYQGSDWIAHGLLDSIVDAFFPMIRYVDNEVEDIDRLTIDPYVDSQPSQRITPSPSSSDTSIAAGHPNGSGPGPGQQIEMSEKISLDSTGAKIWRHPSPPLYQPRLPQRIINHLKSFAQAHHLDVKIRVPRFLIYVKLFWQPLANGHNTRPHTDRPHAFGRYEMIKRITDTRKLVTGLSRLLHGKHAVVGRMRKRAKILEFEGVEAYIGDLEDHILLLEKSLSHQEYVLSHCQPAYLSHLNVTISYFRAQRDRILLGLTTVTIAVFTMQFCSGIFSMNVRVPHQGRQDDTGFAPLPDGQSSPYWYFIMVICFMLFFAACIATLVRYLRWRARMDLDKKRGNEVPEFWDAYWGWK